MKNTIGLVILAVLAIFLLFTYTFAFENSKLEKLVRFTLEKGEVVAEGNNAFASISKVEKIDGSSERRLYFTVNFGVVNGSIIIISIGCNEEFWTIVKKDDEQFIVTKQKISLNAQLFFDAVLIKDKEGRLQVESKAVEADKERLLWQENFLEEMFNEINKPPLKKDIVL